MANPASTDAETQAPMLVSAVRAAALLGIGRTTLYELIWSGELKPLRIGRCVRFRVSDLEDFVDRLAGSGES
jgi:excisionase family DNA binding protein